MMVTKLLAGAVAAGLLIAGSSVHAVAAGPPSDEVYGYTDFYSVPRLGHETVSGTGCGGDGSVGTTIPDGLWRGYARGFDGPTPDESTRVEFDLVCVYRGNVNPELVARWQADHPGQIEPWVLDGFMINNNARTRTVGLADSFWVHGAQWTDTGCPFAQPDVPFNTANDVWISIAGGQAQWMVSSCGGPVEGTAPTTLPPPPAAPTGALAFPYATVYEVPQLGHEPVRGTGCGGDGSIGDVIPDGLWWGAIAGQSTATLEFDLACIYTGPVGEQMGEQFIAANPDYGSPPYWPGVGFFVNNNPRTRTVVLAPEFVRANASWNVAADGTGTCIPPTDPAAAAADFESPTGWLSIVNGQASWFLGECPHD
jgi:hypothetical protein